MDPFRAMDRMVAEVMSSFSAPMPMPMPMPSLFDGAPRREEAPSRYARFSRAQPDRDRVAIRPSPRGFGRRQLLSRDGLQSARRSSTGRTSSGGGAVGGGSPGRGSGVDPCWSAAAALAHAKIVDALANAA